MIRAATPQDFLWLTGRTGYTVPGNARGVVSEVAGRLAGLVAFDAWTPNSAHIHVVVESAVACSRLIREALTYAFSHVEVLVGLIRAGNHKSCALARKVGFRLAHIIPDGWQRGEALHVYELRRDECRWLLPRPEHVVIHLYAFPAEPGDPCSCHGVPMPQPPPNPPPVQVMR